MSQAELWVCRHITSGNVNECGRFVYQAPGLPTPECSGTKHGVANMESQGVFEFEGSFA